MKNCKKHQLPALARLSYNGNFLIQHPATGEFHWFKPTGEWIGLTSSEQKVWNEDEDGWIEGWETIYGGEPDFIEDMICIPINRTDGSWSQPNVFITRFPVGGRFGNRNPQMEDRRGNGNTAKNIFGRRFNLVSNPKQFKLDFTTGIYNYQLKPSAFRRSNRRG